MDFSQLPKMSDTPPPPTQPAAVAPPVAAEPLGMEFALIGAGIGALLLLFFTGPANLYNWAFNPTALPTATDVDGSSIAYAATAFFKADLGFTTFAFTLILEGLLLGSTRAIWIRYLVAIVGLAVVLLNVWVLVVTKSLIGLQLANAIAVLISIVMVITAIKSAKQPMSSRSV